MDITLLILISLGLAFYIAWIFFTLKSIDGVIRFIELGMFTTALLVLWRVFKLNLDFGLVLAAATAFAGLSWSLGQKLDIKSLLEESKSYFWILLVILSIRSFWYEPYQIPSSSMEPGLQIGDFVLVNKHAYGLKFPGTNYLLTKLKKPERNDVAVFVPPHTLCDVSPLQARPDLGALTMQQSQLFLNKFLKLQEDRCTKNGIKYVKRVIGIPGDEVEVKGYEIWINGKKLKHEIISKVNGESLIEETINEEVHVVRTLGLTEYAQHKWKVPEGSYLAMGDNRDNSLDSRAWGYFSEDTLVGKAEYIWLHWSSFSDIPTFSRNQRIK